MRKDTAGIVGLACLMSALFLTVIVKSMMKTAPTPVDVEMAVLGCIGQTIVLAAAAAGFAISRRSAPSK